MFPGLNQVKTNPKVKSLAWVVSREFDYGNVVRFYLVPYKKRWLLISALSKVLGLDWPTIFLFHVQVQVDSIHSRPKKTRDLFQPLGRVRVTEAPLRDTGCHLIVCSLFEGIASRFCNFS